MGRFWTVLVVIVALVIFGFVAVLDPFGFLNQESQVHISTEVVSIGEGFSWNAELTTSPTVIYDQNKKVFKMWYVGRGALERSGVGYITSPDGRAWDSNTRPDAAIENVVFGSSSQSDRAWDAGGFKDAHVMKDGNLYRMWYTADNLVEGDSTVATTKIGYATSRDGQNWAKHASSPVLVPGTGDEWDNHSVSSPVVIKEGKLFRMWYTGWISTNDGEKDRSYIGYASSPDGINWSKHDTAVFAGLSDWDAGGVSTPEIIPVRTGQLYEMWFTGMDKAGHSAIGRAYSDDGLRWGEDEKNPLIANDDFDFFEPSVFKFADSYYLWLERKQDRRDTRDTINFTIWPLADYAGLDDLNVRVPINKY